MSGCEDITIGQAFPVIAEFMPDGTVLAPGLSFVNNPSTGFYRPAADTLGIAAGGSPSAWFSPTLATFAVDIEGKGIYLAPSTTGSRNTDKAILTEQWATGTVAGPTSLNQFKIWADDVDATNSGGEDYFVEGFTFERYFGGSSARGGRNGLSIYQYLTAPTNAASDNRNYSALNGVMTALAGDGGTDPASGATSKGAIFGGGSVAVAASGATALLNASGWEFNVAMQTGSSVWAKTLAQFSSRSDDAVKGSGIDAMLWLYNQSGSNPKWTYGVLFDNGGGYGSIPFNSSSTLIKLGAGTIGTGIDLNDATITGNLIQGPGVSISGDGMGAIELGGVSKTPYLDFHTGASFIDYDARIAASGGNGSIGQGTLTVTAAQLGLSGTLSLTGNLSRSSWTLTGPKLSVVGGTLTDTSGSGTIAQRAVNSFTGATLASSSSVTLTQAATVYIEQPFAGTNTTIGNRYALLTDGSFAINSKSQSGVATGPYSVNSIYVPFDDIDARNGGGTDYFVEGLTVRHRFGGSNTRGGRIALNSILELLTTPASDGDNFNFVGAQGQSQASVSAGGSGLTAATARGQFFGLGAVGRALSGATNLYNVTGIELNTEMRSGSSVLLKSIIQLSGTPLDAVKGSVVDTMLWAYKQNSTAAVFTNGILFDYDIGSGTVANFFPFDSSSTVFKIGAGTIGTGIDMSATTITTYAWTSPGFTINGSGAAVAASLTLNGLLSTKASATGGAGLRIPHGAAPSSPVDGDMWTTTAGAFIRINGVTKTFTLT